MDKNKQIINRDRLSIEQFGVGYPPGFTKYGTVINGRAHFHQFSEEGKCVRNDGRVHVWRRCCSKCGGHLDEITITERQWTETYGRVTEADGREWRVD